MNKVKVGVGLYVGKFMAYHKGHQYYINKFASECVKLNLILCGNTKSDRVKLSVRRQWLENDINFFSLSKMKSKIKFHTLIEDQIAPYPEGLHEWCNKVQDLLGEKIDVMFGNDDYVPECAKVFDSAYSMPDQGRHIFNVSSTKILDNDLKFYDLLTDVAKPYFNKKVLITGPESTGKSVLVRQLALHFGGDYVDEYGRKHEEETIRKSGQRCTEWSVKEYEKIAEIQDVIIKQTLEKKVKLLFVDTDALVTQMYCELYLKQKCRENQTIDAIIKQQNFDLILYLDWRGTDWVSDDLRFLHAPDDRDNVGNSIKRKLQFYNKKYIEVDNSGGYEERLERVKKIIAEKFNL